MKTIAKVVLVDSDDNYLMMYRSNHPTFGDDPDLPGGVVEAGEAPLLAAVREVQEEAGLTIEAGVARELYFGNEYSAHGTNYVLYKVTLSERPKIERSWEHSSSEWVSHETFLKIAKSAKDTYMHMVYDKLNVPLS